MIIKVKLDQGAGVPVKSTEGSAGFDLTALTVETVDDGSKLRIDTGVHVAIPKGYVGLVFP